MSAVLKSETAALKLTRRYPHSREKIFRAWTDPQALKRWFCPSAETRVALAEVDLRVGGRFRIDVQSPDGEPHSVSGVYREIAPPEKLVFTWLGACGPDGESLVTVKLNAYAGGTELILTHERLPDVASRERHGKGWNSCLDHLGRVEWA
ncbi:MAG: SRPBCC family protein [Stenotrophobium sp.]